MTTDRLPPQSLEAEQSVLAAILLENEAIHAALELLTPEDFYREAHRIIFKRMVELSEEREAIDLVTLTHRLRREGELERVGGATYLSELLTLVPTAARIQHHARIVREKALMRNLIRAATDIAAEAYDGKRPVDDLLDEAEHRIFEIAERRVRRAFTPMREIVKDSFETIERLYERRERVTGIPTGFRDLDERTSGFQPGDLIVVAGRPSMGKTAFCLNIAQHVGIERKQPVAIFSLEMTKEQLVTRMLCSEARVDAHKLRSSYLGESDWPRLTMAAGRLAEAPIFIDDTAALSILEMRAKARRLQAEHGLDLLIVDYLQLVRGHGTADNREQEISEISRSLKALAKELKAPVVALSQLNRSVESRADRRPILADLRESGAIEQDADVVLFIYRDEVYHPDREESHGKAEIIIGKQRNGPTGTVPLSFISAYTRFENYTAREEAVYF